MNDYASYLGRAAPFERTERGIAPTSAYFRTMQSRLYDFDGRELPALGIPPLASFRLVFASRTGIVRGGRFLARWKVFEISDGGGGRGSRQGRGP
jgi:hypothetical protein